MLQAMNTGHEGSMATIHANTTRDALSRLESMVAMSNLNLPEKTVRHQIASAIAIVVQISRLSDGTRKVMSISEITGMEENVVSMQEIFTFNRRESAPTARCSAHSSRPTSGPGPRSHSSCRHRSFAERIRANIGSELNRQRDG